MYSTATLSGLSEYTEGWSSILRISSVQTAGPGAHQLHRSICQWSSVLLYSFNVREHGHVEIPKIIVQTGLELALGLGGGLSVDSEVLLRDGVAFSRQCRWRCYSCGSQAANNGLVQGDEAGHLQQGVGSCFDRTLSLRGRAAEGHIQIDQKINVSAFNPREPQRKVPGSFQKKGSGVGGLWERCARK